MTEMAKAAGGPDALMDGLVDKGRVQGGHAVGLAVGAYFGVKKLIKFFKKNTNNENYIVLQNLEINNDCVDDNGVALNKGDKIEVLSIDFDSILINVVGDHNSPYNINPCFLEKNTNYKHNINPLSQIHHTALCYNLLRKGYGTFD